MPTARHKPHTAPPVPLAVVNLEAGMPTVPQALSRLNDALRQAKRDQTAVIKIVHGWGSTGVGGALRLAVQRELAQMTARRELRAFIAGEDWRISNEDAWAMIQTMPALKEDRDLGKANKGISLVWM